MVALRNVLSIVVGTEVDCGGSGTDLAGYRVTGSGAVSVTAPISRVEYASTTVSTPDEGLLPMTALSWSLHYIK